MEARKTVGWNAPCKKGKYHSVGIFTGVCSNCQKQIHKSEPERKAAFDKVMRGVN